MKHKITTAICIVVLVVLSVFVYQAVKSGEAKRAVAAAKAASATYYKQQAQTQLVKSEQAQLDTQCAQQAKVYSQLPAAQQAKVAKPECNLAPVE